VANNHIVVGINGRAQELRTAISFGVQFRNAIHQLRQSMSQYGADNIGYAAIESDFNLQAGTGQAVKDMIGSAADEAFGGTPVTFIAQLLDRCG
jgi:hypothetical protein